LTFPNHIFLTILTSKWEYSLAYKPHPPFPTHMTHPKNA
jgi:hypothetical protein